MEQKERQPNVINWRTIWTISPNVGFNSRDSGSTTLTTFTVGKLYLCFHDSPWLINNNSKILTKYNFQMQKFLFCAVKHSSQFPRKISFGETCFRVHQIIMVDAQYVGNQSRDHVRRDRWSQNKCFSRLPTALLSGRFGSVYKVNTR